VRVTLPEGVKLLAAPRPLTFEHPLKARFQAAANVSGQTVELTRTLRLPVGRIPPEGYDDFAEFCRDVDLAEASELVVQLP
jgi:hypothetical protein